MADPQTVQAVGHRQVDFTVGVEPWPKRWGPTLAHLRTMHGQSTPRGPVVHPEHLARWHTDLHADEDAWIVEGNPTVTPHLHLSAFGRLRQWWEFR
jgi:hypothetical protein